MTSPADFRAIAAWLRLRVRALVLVVIVVLVGGGATVQELSGLVPAGR